MVVPFFHIRKVSYTGSETQTFEWTVPEPQSEEIDEIWATSTGTFSITDIEDSNGCHFMPPSEDEPILSTMLREPKAHGEGLGVFPIPVIIPGGGYLHIRVKDTSATTNAITIILVGKRTFT